MIHYYLDCQSSTERIWAISAEKSWSCRAFIYSWSIIMGIVTSLQKKFRLFLQKRLRLIDQIHTFMIDYYLDCQYSTEGIRALPAEKTSSCRAHSYIHGRLLSGLSRRYRKSSSCKEGLLLYSTYVHVRSLRGLSMLYGKNSSSSCRKNLVL